MPQRVVLIYSPHSGRSSKLPDAIKHLEQAELEVGNSISIADLDNLSAQGIVWKERGIDVAIAAGGDGLVGGVITHIAESGLSLGILPLGTSNDIDVLRMCPYLFVRTEKAKTSQASFM